MLGNILQDGKGRLCIVDKIFKYGFSAPAINSAVTTVNKAHSGIPFTPEILTEWCGFELCKPCVNFPAGFNKMPYYAKNGILLFFNEGDLSKFLFAKADQRFGYYSVVESAWHDKLHELQCFYYWNSGKQQLAIKIPK